MANRTVRPLNQLRAFYQDGRRLLKKYPEDRVPYGTLRKLAGPSRNQDYLNKSRRLAKTFSPVKFERMLAHAKEARHSLGIKLMINLLRVPQEHRMEFFRRILKEQWSSRRLDLEIRRAFGSRRRGAGRKIHVADDSKFVLVQLDGLCRRWSQALNQVCAAELPTTVKRLAMKAQTSLNAVNRHLEKSS